MARNAPKGFPWIGGQNAEATFQFTFRFQTGQTKQTLFCIGAEDQSYTTGWLTSSTHWRLHHLVVSIQTAESRLNSSSIVVTRDEPGGSEHRDNDLHHYAKDYNFRDGEDYSIFISRAGMNYGEQPGSALTIAIFNHTLHEPDGTGINGWKLWPHDANVSQIKQEGFYGASYSGDARNEIMWALAVKRVTS